MFKLSFGYILTSSLKQALIMGLGVVELLGAILGSRTDKKVKFPIENIYTYSRVISKAGNFFVSYSYYKNLL